MSIAFYVLIGFDAGWILSAIVLDWDRRRAALDAARQPKGEQPTCECDPLGEGLPDHHPWCPHFRKVGDGGEQ